MQLKKTIWDNIGVVLIATILFSFMFAATTPEPLATELVQAYKAGQSNDQLVLIIEAHDFLVPFAIFSIVEWISILALIVLIVRTVYRGIKGIPLL